MCIGTGAPKGVAWVLLDVERTIRRGEPAGYVAKPRTVGRLRPSSSVRRLRVTSTVLRDIGDRTRRQVWLFIESEVAEGDDSDQSLIAVYDR